MVAYSQRIIQVTQEVQKLLNGYEPPRSRADDTEWQRQEIRDVAEAVNSSIPRDMTEDGIRTLFERMRRDLKKQAKTRAWPITREIVDAVADKTPKEHFRSAQILSFDTDAINARRINKGEAVAETYVNGSGADRLLQKNLVTMEALSIYRQSLQDSIAEVYGMPEEETAEDYPF